MITFQISGPSHIVSLARMLCAIAILQLCSGLAAAQESIPKALTTPTPGLHLQAIPDAERASETSPSPGVSAKDPLLGNGPAETPKMLEAREEYVVYAWKNRRDAFAWQSISTKMIFLIVIFVVLAGLYLSWMQFRAAHKMPMKITAPSAGTLPSAGTPGDQLDAKTTSIELNTGGLKITSSVIGLVILTLSIVFFFLYLKFVYPIIQL